jgi:hypothetical protein
MGTEFTAKLPGVDIFKTGGVVLTDRRTNPSQQRIFPYGENALKKTSRQSTISFVWQDATPYPIFSKFGMSYKLDE